jgi:hypothetical protein
VAYSTVTRSLREAKLGTVEVILDPDPSSPRVNNYDRAILAARDEKKGHFRAFKNLTDPPISHTLLSMEGSPNGSGSSDIFVAGCGTFCQTLRK